MSEKTKMELLDEADELLHLAWSAMLKLGLRGCGSDTSLSHEVRMFALAFNEEGREGPGALQVTGSGQYRAWRKAFRKLRQE